MKQREKIQIIYSLDIKRKNQWIAGTYTLLGQCQIFPRTIQTIGIRRAKRLSAPTKQLILVSIKIHQQVEALQKSQMQKLYRNVYYQS